MKRQYWVLAASVTMMVLGAAVATAMAGEPATAPAVAAGGDEMAKAVHSAGIAIAGALVVGISVVGAGIAVGRIGSAAIGAATEKPELFFKSVMYVGLAEGLAILGFAMAFLLKSLG
jgi:V/A-type H+-transporting ATPase subunit K